MISQLQSPSLPSAVVAEHTYLQVPSQPEWIAPTVAYLKDRAVLCGACHEARSNKLQLALHEALTNSVIHGNLELASGLKERCDNAFAEALAERAADPRYAARAVEVHFDYDGEHGRWTFTDQGKGFDTARALARAAQPDAEAMLASGRGILLMRAFLDDLRYELGGRRAILTLARPSGEDKRAVPRQALQRPVHVAPIRGNGVVDWDAAYQAVAQNLSSGGMAILQSRLASSERILIGIEHHGEMLYVPAEVRHCQARGGDMVELGCRFQVPPAASMNAASSAGMERDLDTFLEQLSSSSVRSDEHRAHPRVAYTARITITIGRGHPPAIGFGRDLSRGGISFLTTTPLPLENVTLTLPQHDREALRIRARVVRCHQLMSSIYDVGAGFLANADDPE